MDTRAAFEKLYAKKGGAPWTFQTPHEEIVRLVKSKKIMPCKTLEIGCGEGWHAIYLSSMGFDVTGIDFSKNAIKYAKRSARERKVTCKFIVKGWKELDNLGGKFDFIFDWRFLMEIIDEKERELYIEKVSKKLKKNGTYLSTNFSSKSSFAGKGKIRKLPDGITLYFAGMRDMKSLFTPYFNIIQTKTVRVPEKGYGNVACHMFLMKKA